MDDNRSVVKVAWQKTDRERLTGLIDTRIDIGYRWCELRKKYMQC